MRSKKEIAAALAFVLAVCVWSGCGGDDPALGERESAAIPAEDRGVTAELEAIPAEADGRLWSEGRTASVKLPGGWGRVDDLLEGSLLTVSSFPVSEGSFLPACRPSRVLRQMPADGALIRVREMPPPRPAGRAGSDSRPPGFRLGKLQRHKHRCGEAFSFKFIEGGRALGVSIWARPRARSRARSHPNLSASDGRRRFVPSVRREVESILNSLEVQPAGAEPVHRPFIALDCRNPPNAIDCDRIYVQVSTRVPMRWVSVRIGDRVVELNAAGTHGGAVPVGAPRTNWSGYMRDAGLTSEGSELEIPLAPGKRRWVGVPPVKATVEVIGRRPGGPTGKWIFPRVGLLAGHG